MLESQLLVDLRPSVPPAHAARDVSSSTTAAPSTASAGSPTSSLPSASTASAVPSPFDTPLGSNFTAPCQSFLQRFVTNATFNACHPFSLLLQTSSAFFDASKSFVRITSTLEATCNVDSAACLAVMQDFATGIRQNANCGTDYSEDNPIVLEAYNGLVSYQPLYQAGCLRDTKGNFCFANAITNTTSLTDSYPYYLPLGIKLPGGSRPTCNTCLQDSMAIFSAFATNSSQPISQTYNDAAAQMDQACGPTFVNQTASPLKAVGVAAPIPLFHALACFLVMVAWLAQ